MASPLYIALLLASLLAFSSAGIVTLSNLSTVTVSDPLIITLSSSYSGLGSSSWTRIRNSGGSYDLFTQSYELAGTPGCTIKCGPYSHPVVVNHNGPKLACSRDLTHFDKNHVSGNAPKQNCVPDVHNNGGGFTCNVFTSQLPTANSGYCNEASVVNLGYSWSTFDCCHDNNNSGQSGYNEFYDNGATL